MADAPSKPGEIRYSAAQAREARALLEICAALACARKLRAEGRRLAFDSRGGLTVDPPLDDDERLRYASAGPALEKLLSPPLKDWAEYIDGASVLLEELAAAGARPREADGRLLADLAPDAARMRIRMDFYSAAAVKLLRAQAIVHAAAQQPAPWWRRAFAWR